MAKSSKSHTSEEDSALKLAAGTLQHGLERIDGYVRDPDSSELRPESANALAQLLAKVAQVAGELRKADAEERRRSELNTPDAIVTAIRGLSARERQTVVSEIERMNATRSGLS